MAQQEQNQLAEKVYACVSRESNEGAAETYTRALPEDQQGLLTIFELDHKDFAMMAGVAYGIARGEDPYETDESVVERAVAATQAAFNRWSDKFRLSYTEDRAARPVPVLYPHNGADAKPSDVFEDLAVGLETAAERLEGDERKAVERMSQELAQIGLRVYERSRRGSVGLTAP